MRTITPLLLPLLLAACAPLRSTHEAPSSHGPLVYSCDDGLTLRVRLARDGAHVTLPSGEQLFLPQQSAGSSTYGTAQHQLSGQGGETTWRAGTRVPVACRVQR